MSRIGKQAKNLFKSTRTQLQEQGDKKWENDLFVSTKSAPEQFHTGSNTPVKPILPKKNNDPSVNFIPSPSTSQGETNGSMIDSKDEGLPIMGDAERNDTAEIHSNLIRDSTQNSRSNQADCFPVKRTRLFHRIILFLIFAVSGVAAGIAILFMLNR